jgi:hypothetical protein
MSLRENIQFFYPLDIDQYLEILKTSYDSVEHPNQDGSFFVNGLPFYQPQNQELYVFILGFNLIPLSPTLIQVCINQPDLIPLDTHIRWTQEQDLIFAGILSNFREHFKE